MFASGNNGLLDDDCGATALCTSIYTNCIGSAAVNGRQAFYDVKCSSKMAVAFVSGSGVGPISVVSEDEKYTKNVVLKVNHYLHIMIMMRLIKTCSHFNSSFPEHIITQ